MDKVSVVIPCYNHARFLGLAVTSVINQTHKNYEVVIIDDGSSDNTRAIASGLLAPNIKYIYQQNQGLSAARNTGIANTSGDYLVFLDADDELEAKFLEKCLGVMTSDTSARIAGVYCLGYFIDENGQLLPSLAGSDVVPPFKFRERIVEGRLHPVHAAMIRRNAVNEIGGFDCSLTALEDWDYWLRLSSLFTMQGISEPLVRYRVVSNSMSVNADTTHLNRVSLLVKHFGPPNGAPQDWTEEKHRAYGFGFKRSALHYMAQGNDDMGWQLLESAFRYWLPLLVSPETFYELICVTQPRGFHGQAGLIDFVVRESSISERLDAFFARSDSNVQSMRRAAFGNMYVSLAMLSDQSGDWSKARSYLLKSLSYEPTLGLNYSNVRRLLKLSAGQTVVNMLRKPRLSTRS